MALIGLSFPFRKEAGEFPKKDREQDAVRSNIIALFNLPLGSRVMRPFLGTTVYNLVFEPINDLLVARLERSIRATVERGEPRATIQSVTITSDKTTIFADIVYAVNGLLNDVQISLNRGT
jgi:phage baseplate assembly protein W